MDAADYLSHAREHFAAIRRKAERALAQVDDAQFFATLDPDANSIALLMKHLAGNMRSRWTDFLTTDGEKPDRSRDTEFVLDPEGDTRPSIEQRWGSGWATLHDTLDGLSPEDLDRTLTIRDRPLTVLQTIERHKEHYAYHVGQIVFLARHLAGPAWTSISIPRGQTAAFHAARRHT